MLTRLADMMQGGVRLLRAEAHSLLDGARRSAMWTGVALAAVGLVLVAAVGLLVSVTALMATELGWIAALAITSAVVALLGVLAFLGARAAARRALAPGHPPPSIRAEGDAARRQLRGEQPPSEVPATPRAASSSAGSRPRRTAPSLPAAAIEYVTRHPGQVAGGALLLTAVAGPRRTFRFATRTAAVVNMVLRVRDASRSDGWAGLDVPPTNGAVRPRGDRETSGGMPPMTASPPMTGSRWAVDAPVDAPCGDEAPSHR